MQSLERPRVKLQGCWCHKVCLFLHVVEVRQPSDATMVAESVCKTLEAVKNRLGDKMPRKVLIWALCQDLLSVLQYCLNGRLLLFVLLVSGAQVGQN